MLRKTLLASTFAVLMAGSASWALAQNAPPPPANGGVSAPGTQMPAPGVGPHDGRGKFRPGMHDMAGPIDGVIGDLRELERLYMESGRSKELTALYNDVLAKSQDPRVRDYVYKHLARLQARPGNVDQAIATLRKGLDENLANEAKMCAEREKMRIEWQQRAQAEKHVAPAAAQ